MENQSLTKLHSIVRFLRASSRYYLQNFNLKLFLKFLKDDPEISSIINSLQEEHSHFKDDLDKAEGANMRDNLQKLREKIESFEEFVAFCIFYVEKAVAIRGSTIIDHFLPDTTSEPGVGFEKDKKRFLDDCIEPIVIYIELQIKHSVNAAYILQRYKILCEWYDREELFKSSELDITKGHLSKFLFDSGFTYSLSETTVPSGRIDNFALSIGLKDKTGLSDLPNAIIAEGKIYESNKSIFEEVFNQVQKRVMDLNFNDGYCVIFNKSSQNVTFENFKGNINGVPYKIDKNSRIYFLIINLHNDFYSSTKTLANVNIDINFPK